MMSPALEVVFQKYDRFVLQANVELSSSTITFTRARELDRLIKQARQQLAVIIVREANSENDNTPSTELQG